MSGDNPIEGGREKCEHMTVVQHHLKVNPRMYAPNPKWTTETIIIQKNYAQLYSNRFDDEKKNLIELK